MLFFHSNTGRFHLIFKCHRNTLASNLVLIIWIPKNVQYRHWHLPSPFLITFRKTEWIDQFLFQKFFNGFTKTNKLKLDCGIKLVGSQCLLKSPLCITSLVISWGRFHKSWAQTIDVALSFSLFAYAVLLCLYKASQKLGATHCAVRPTLWNRPQIVSVFNFRLTRRRAKPSCRWSSSSTTDHFQQFPPDRNQALQSRQQRHQPHPKCTTEELI